MKFSGFNIQRKRKPAKDFTKDDLIVQSFSGSLRDVAQVPSPAHLASQLRAPGQVIDTFLVCYSLGSH